MSTTGCMDSSAGWMNSGGQTPCEVLESVLSVCGNASVPNLSVDVSCGSLGNSSSACCCSTATYALVSACWVCQTNRSPNLLSSTYESWWSGCPVELRLNGSLPAVVISHSPSIPVPTWALIPPTGTHWNLSSAQLAVGITASPTPSTPISSPTSTPQPTYTPKPTNPPYAPIAVCSVIALGLLLGMAAWLYRRRNRVAPASRPPPDFEIDGGALGIPKQDRPRPASWTWWKSLGRSPPQSDPGKIDAWRYPFDYEPVSTGPSSGSSSQRYYDPFRPRRNSAVDSVGVRGQNSSGTLGQYHSSTQNLHGRATPSPIPGGSTPQTYPAVPPGINVNHTSSFALGHPQPPTYGQAIPYTYPYQPAAYQQPYQPPSSYQPVPSSSTTSPLSPHHARPRRPAEQMVMIPIDQMSPVQIEQLRLQFPDLKIKRKRRRRQEAETDQERGRARAGTDAQFRPRSASARPRSMSVPVVNPEEDGRPRNGVELREKYEQRRRSRSGGEGIVTITTRRGSVVVQGGEVVLRGSGERQPSGDGRRDSWDARQAGWEADAGRVRARERERGRAQDAGVSLMGGPPRRG